MNVSEVMNRNLVTCRPGDSLAAAAQLMWDHDCGAVPVIDGQGAVIAVITDRDICMAALFRGQALSVLRVADAASRKIIVVMEHDSLHAAEALMRKHQVRRLPVVDLAGRPVGVLSLNDLARHAGHGGVREHEVIGTLAAICTPAPHAVPAR